MKNNCRYTYKDASGREITIQGLAALKSFLATGGLEMLRGDVRMSPAREGEWQLIDNDLPSREAAERIIKMRTKGNSVVKPLDMWSGYELRAVESDNPGFWAIEARRLAGDVRQSQARDITDTPEFKAWFKDSKVVDAEGKPLVVYHGTHDKAPGKFRPRSFFTDSPELAALYAESRALGRGQGEAEFGRDGSSIYPGAVVVPAYLSLQNPLVVDAAGADFASIQFEGATVSTNALARIAEERGHDGVIVENVVDSPRPRPGDTATTYIAIRPEQIKSAIGNSGAFDPDDPDIRRSAERSVTETPEFKRWLDGAKIVDGDHDFKTGEPVAMLLYHGTNSDFSTFSPAAIGSRYGYTKGGFHFTNDSEVASRYASPSKFAPTGSFNVMPVYVRMRKPLVIDSDVNPILAFDTEIGSITKRMRSKHDGLIILGKARSTVRDDRPEEGRPAVVEPGATMQGKRAVHVVAFSPSQIKSAIGNNGQFDPQDPDITRSPARPQFYSQLQRAIDQVPERLSTMAAPQWKLWLDANASKLGIKKDEIEWSGIGDYLKLRGKDKISKDDLVRYLGDSGVKVQEVVLENEPMQGNGWDGVEGGAKYAQYTVPGGENYREVLITLPREPDFSVDDFIDRMSAKYGREAIYDIDGIVSTIKADFPAMLSEEDQREFQRLEKSKKPDPVPYRSSHWDEPNILAHLRIDDRTDADGKRVLFINEVQSDFGQDYRKQRASIEKAVDEDFEGIVERMKKAGVLTVECD